MNVQLSFNVVFVIYSTLAGIIGALGMIFVINLFSRFAWTRVNIIKALGSLFGRPPKQSLTLGIIFHLIAGIIFAMLYRSEERRVGKEWRSRRLLMYDNI